MDQQRGEVALGEAQFFRRLSPEQLARVEHQVRSRQYYPRRRLFTAGDPAEFLWVVERGSIRLVQSSSKGQVTTLEMLGPGEMFGLWSGAPDEVYGATAEAVSDGRAWCLPRSVVQRLLGEAPELASEMVSIIATRLREAQERLHSFAYDAAPARLAAALLRAANGGEAHVTRRALAEASGTTVETAIRVLRRFEAEGWIRGEVGSISILVASKLAGVAGGGS